MTQVTGRLSVITLLCLRYSTRDHSPQSTTARMIRVSKTLRIILNVFFLLILFSSMCASAASSSLLLLPVPLVPQSFTQNVTHAQIICQSKIAS